MPIFLNLFAVVDGAGSKPSLGEEAMLVAYSEANRYWSAASGLVFPMAYQTYTINYQFSFGDPFNCGLGPGDKQSQRIVNALQMDTLKYVRQFYVGTSLFINVFFVWELKSFQEDTRPRGATLGHQTIALADDKDRLGLVLAHEIGHGLLGPGHADEEGNLMNADVDHQGAHLTSSQLTRIKQEYTRRSSGAPGGWQV
jgi:hypothetical protein